MIKLYRLPNNDWIVHCPGYNVNVIGTWKEAEEALWHCGVEYTDMHEAVLSMVEHNHNLADFGINKTFMVSSNYENTGFRVA